MRAYTSLNAAKSLISAKKHVGLTTLSRDEPAASRTALTLSNDISACDALGVGPNRSRRFVRGENFLIHLEHSEMVALNLYVTFRGCRQLRSQQVEFAAQTGISNVSQTLTSKLSLSKEVESINTFIEGLVLIWGASRLTLKLYVTA